MKRIKNYLDIIYKYLDEYYKFKYKFCIIIFDINLNLKNINNSQFDIYFINNILNDNIDNNINNNINNLKIIDINDNFNILQSKLINLDYDYFYIPKNNDIEIDTN